MTEPDDVLDVARFLGAAQSALEARVFDVARVNAALAALRAVHVLARHGGELTVSGRIRETDQLIEKLEAEGVFRPELAQDVHDLIDGCRPGIFTTTGRVIAEESVAIAARAVGLVRLRADRA
jgi:hypothetical protein